MQTSIRVRSRVTWAWAQLILPFGAPVRRQTAKEILWPMVRTAHVIHLHDRGCADLQSFIGLGGL